MSAVEPAREAIVRQLQKAVERLQDDIARVEFWTDALGGFAQSIPDYDPVNSKLNQFILPGHASDSAVRDTDNKSGLNRVPNRPSDSSPRR